MLRDRSIVLEVDPGVYAPVEDTFLMLSALSVVPGEKVMEMGCGSGFLSLHLARAGADVVAVDLDRRAVANAVRNAVVNDIRLQVLSSDLFSDVEGEYDLLIFNPPYLRGTVQSDEDLCWAGGEDGVEVTARFLRGARDHLAPGGRVLLLLSSDMDDRALEQAMEGWEKRTLASRSLFFEELSVLELTLPGRP